MNIFTAECNLSRHCFPSNCTRLHLPLLPLLHVTSSSPTLFKSQQTDGDVLAQGLQQRADMLLYRSSCWTSGSDDGSASQSRVEVWFTHYNWGVWGSSFIKYCLSNSSFPAFWWILMQQFIVQMSLYKGNDYSPLLFKTFFTFKTSHVFQDVLFFRNHIHLNS